MSDLPGPVVPPLQLPTVAALLAIAERAALDLVLEIGLAAFVDPINMANFTLDACLEIRNQNPYKNVMIVHGGFNFALYGVTHVHYEFPLEPIVVPRTQGYEIYTFDSGTFNLTSDGGFRNWCFAGAYTRDPNNDRSVTFYQIEQPPPPPPPPSPLPSPTDGVYLVNSVKGNLKSSGFAYYSRIGNNEGTLPQFYVDILSGGSVIWEGNAFSATFKDGSTFFVIADLEGQSAPQNGPCGSGHSNTRNMTVYKDDFHVIYNIDGWAVHAVYYCK